MIAWKLTVALLKHHVIILQECETLCSKDDLLISALLIRFNRKEKIAKYVLQTLLYNHNFCKVKNKLRFLSHLEQCERLLQEPKIRG